MLQVSHERISDVDVVCVTSPELEMVRGHLAMPFDGAVFRDSGIEELPHVFEHVGCNDSRLPQADYLHLMTADGGALNGFTFDETHGKLSFVTAQPSHKPDLVMRFLANALYPTINEQTIGLERAIVQNELIRKTGDTEHRRVSQRNFDLGLTYRTPELGLRSIGNIATHDVKDFQQSITSRPNIRFVLSGEPAAVAKIVEGVDDMLCDIPDTGNRWFTRPGLMKVANYHRDSSEIPTGMTEYWYGQYATASIAKYYNGVDFSVIANAFSDAINGGGQGMHVQSRQTGVSYGVGTNIHFDDDTIALTMGDKLQTQFVLPQIALLQDRLNALRKYTPFDFEAFKRKNLGRLKIQPEQPANSIAFIESIVTNNGVEETDFVTCYDYRQALEYGMPGEIVAATIRHLAEILVNFDFTSHTSFGTNPFSDS